MTTTQSHIQDQLQRKHEELQQLIVHQQEELRRVSEQLLMARYGLLPSIVNVALPFNPIGHVPRTSQSHGNTPSTSVTPSGHQSILQIDNNATTANNQMNHSISAIEQIDNQGNNQSQNDEIISYIELQSTSNTAISEHSLEQHSMTSLHEHQRQDSHERQPMEPTWDPTSDQQLLQMQQSGNVQVLPQNSLLQIEASNQQQLQCENRHLPATPIATTTPANAEDLEILPDY